MQRKRPRVTVGFRFGTRLTLGGALGVVLVLGLAHFPVRSVVAAPDPLDAAPGTASPIVGGAVGQAFSLERWQGLVKANDDLSRLPLRVQFWVKAEPGRGIVYLISNEAPESSGHWSLYLYGGGVPAVYVPAFTPSHVRSSKSVRDGQWHELTIVIDGKRVAIRVDGKDTTDVPIKLQTDIKPTGGPMLLGGFPGLPRQACPAAIDDLRLAHTAFMPRPDDEPARDLRAYWSFDEFALGHFPSEERGERNRRPMSAWLVKSQVVTTPAPVPDAASLKQAHALIDDLVKGGLVPKGQDAGPALLKLARDPQTDSASRYVCLDRVRDAAVRRGDLAEAMAAVDQLVAGFALPPGELRGRTLQDIARNLRRFTDWSSLAMRHLDAAGEGFAAGDIDLADRMARLADTHARLGKNPDLWAHVRAVTAFLRDRRKLHEQYTAWLEAATKDTDAAVKAGLYLGLVQGQWPDARAMLAGAGESWKALVELEAGVPETEEELLAIADTWHEFAAGQATPLRELMIARAGGFYLQVRHFLSGVPRARADVRLKEARALPQAPTIGFGRAVNWDSDRALVKYKWVGPQTFTKKQTDDSQRELLDGELYGKSGLAWDYPNKPAALGIEFPAPVKPRVARLHIELRTDRDAMPDQVRAYAGDDKRPGKLLGTVRPKSAQSGWIEVPIEAVGDAVSRWFWLEIAGAPTQRRLTLTEIEFR